MTALFTRKNVEVQDPPLARFLFSNTVSSWFWLLVRLWLGYQWIEASMHKLSNPAWTQTGEAVKGFWTNAVLIPDTGKAAITFDWYRSFLTMMLNIEAYRFMGPLIAYGELLIGIALIVGLFTGIAAFFGGFLNWNFMMSGAASTNPVLFALAVLLVLAWKVAGYIGLDYFVLPLVGTPWAHKPVEEATPLVTSPARA